MNSDDDDDNLYLIQPSANATRQELLDALKASQVSVMRLLNENRKLRQTNSELLAASSKKKQRAGAPGADTLGYKSQVVGFAKHFLFTRALFVDRRAFQGVRPEPPITPEAQFASDAAYIDSITTALYDDIPDRFHALLDVNAYPNFATDFIHEHGEGRSILVNAVRRALPIILKGLNIDPTLLTMASADRSNHNVLTSLLRFPNERKATLFAPVLFPGPSKDMNKIFTGPIFLQVHRMMYYGPSSLTAGAKPARNSNGVKLGIYKITEGSVSLAAIISRFVVSPDKEWATKGAISNIDWEGDYQSYFKLLVTHRHLPHVKKIFKKIHEFVFAGITLPSTGTAVASDDDIEDAIVEDMARFALGRDDDSDGEDNAGVSDQPFAIPDPAYREAHLAAPLGDGTLGFTNPATIQAPVAGPHHEPRQVRDMLPPPPVEVPPPSEVIQPEVDAEQLAARGRGRRRGGAQTDSGEGQTSGPTTRRKGKGRAT
ncbi:hypothetical protein B0H10DRAFT_1959460 [Mycena sp. CBHHK59/15]|nr:hypothetical protein B0H10DRAFT_1959460 [Mycena sp. CBHHK59/15]